MLLLHVSTLKRILHFTLYYYSKTGLSQEVDLWPRGHWPYDPDTQQQKVLFLS